MHGRVSSALFLLQCYSDTILFLHRNGSAIRETDGGIICWGQDSSSVGKVCSFSLSTDIIHCIAVVHFWAPVQCKINKQKTIFQISNLPIENRGYISVSCGPEHTSALTSDGRVVSWGDEADFRGNAIGEPVDRIAANSLRTCATTAGFPSHFICFGSR